MPIGPTWRALPLERLVNVPIVMIRVLDRLAVSADDLGERDRLWGRAVLVHTGWSRHWGTDRYLDFAALIAIRN